MSGDRPPLDPRGFERFARSLTVGDIADAILDAEPLDDPVPHRFPASTWRRYDRLRLPDGFAVIGDGICSFNPIYGQGMTIAALEADALDRHLTRHGRLRPQRFQRQVARIIGPAWQMAAGADLQFPHVEGRRTRAQRALSAYVVRLHAAAAYDPFLSRAFVRVSGLIDPPSALMRPSVLLRVLRSDD
jgi:2-polyprenyl-6-methoxyphenol hydroxylase-like FAD-dependent oxidoreductase